MKNKSIHLEKFINFPETFKNENLNSKWIELIKLREQCNLSIEEKRANKEIGSSLEASLEIELDKTKFELIKSIDLAELCIASKVQIKLSEQDMVKITTTKAEGTKCPTCWKISKLPCKRHSN